MNTVWNLLLLLLGHCNSRPHRLPELVRRINDIDRCLLEIFRESVWYIYDVIELHLRYMQTSLQDLTYMLQKNHTDAYKCLKILKKQGPPKYSTIYNTKSILERRCNFTRIKNRTLTILNATEYMYYKVINISIIDEYTRRIDRDNLEALY